MGLHSLCLVFIGLGDDLEFSARPEMVMAWSAEDHRIAFVRGRVDPQPPTMERTARMTLVTTSTTDRLLSLAFSLKSTPGSYAVLLGAGISVASGVPSAWSVLTDLLSQLSLARNVQVPLNGEDLVTWYLEEFNEEPTYESVLERLAPTQYDRQAILRGYFEATEEQRLNGAKQPTAAHHHIAQMIADGVINVVITTNFDGLMETALRDRGVEPTVIRGQGDLTGLGPLHTAKATVIHLHGHYLSPEEMRNTGPELTDYTEEAERFLDRIMTDFGLVIVGWSAKYDPKLAAAIRRSFRRIYVPYWIDPATPGTEASELITHIRAELIQQRADEAMGELTDYYRFLRERAALHNPQTVPATVSTARRQLAGKETATDLHDLIKRQADALHQDPDLQLSYTGTISKEGAYQGMVQRIEESSEILTAATATAAYWGNDATDLWWLGEIQSFAPAPNAGGLTAVLGLHNVVMARLFHAAGVAALAQGRTETLRALFRLEGDRTRPGREMASQVLIPARVVENVSTASKRLYDQLRPLFVEQLSAGAKAYDERWQEFEVLRMIAAVTASSTPSGNFPSLAELSNSRLAYETAAAAYEEWARVGRPGQEVFEKYEPVNNAKEVYERNLGLWRDRFSVVLPHIKMVRNDDGTYVSPVIRRMIRDASGSGASHPLARAGLLGPDTEHAVEMLRAVSVAVTESHRYQYRPGPSLEETWFDESYGSQPY